jgi:hypothetical protein
VSRSVSSCLVLSCRVPQLACPRLSPQFSRAAIARPRSASRVGSESPAASPSETTASPTRGCFPLVFSGHRGVVVMAVGGGLYAALLSRARGVRRGPRSPTANASAWSCPRRARAR